MGIAEQLLPTGIQGLEGIDAGGLALAVVTNIKDPDKLGRIKCKPVLASKEDLETDWCYVMTPAAGKGYGLFYFPNVDDLVLLGYIGNDVHRPIVLGCYWANKTNAPYKIEDGKNEVISIKTPQGSEIKLDDVKDKCKITIKTPSGAVILINDEGKALEITGDKENKIKLDWKKGEIELSAKSKITLKASGTTLTLDSSSIKGKSSSEVSFDASKIELKSKAAFKAEGATAEIAAKGEAKLTASGMVTIKGGITKIN